jgi:hypothetical protein
VPAFFAMRAIGNSGRHNKGSSFVCVSPGGTGLSFPSPL